MEGKKGIWLERKSKSRWTIDGAWLRRAITGSARPLAGKGFVTKLPNVSNQGWIHAAYSPLLDPCAPILEIEYYRNRVLP